MIDVIDFKNLQNNEKILALSLQGLANRKQPSIYLDIDNYLDYIDESYQYITLTNALKKYRSCFDGCILFNYQFGNVDINIASSLSGILNSIIIDSELISLIDNIENLPILKDIRELDGDYIDRQEKIFDQYNHLFNRDGLIHQVTTTDTCHITLRDAGISNSWFCFFTDETAKAKAFRKKVLNWANKNIAIYGWTTNEIDFVDDISQYGDYIIPSDWSCNHSFLNKKESIEIKQKGVIIKSDLDNPNKHYLTIVVSDGDNAQWLERDFSTTSTFGQRIKTNENYILNFTIAPSLAINSPAVLKRIYSLGKNNYFISGVSGAGYMNPCKFPIEHLDAFCNKTSTLFKKSDLSIVTLLDNISNMNKVSKMLDKYAKFGNIIGGIYEVDPDKYGSAKGEIYYPSNSIFSNKPFAGVRISFWSPDGSNNSVTKEWIDEIANQINNFEVNIYSKTGYTVLNVHPWSIKISDLDYLVSKLSDHVEIVKCDDFIEMIKNNIR